MNSNPNTLQNTTSFLKCKSIFLGFVLSIFALTQVQAQQVTGAVDTTAIRIGEQITYQVSVEADSTDLVLFPEGQTFQPLEMIEAYKIDTSFTGAKINLIKRYGLTQFDSGSYTIPRQLVSYQFRVV